MKLLDRFILDSSDSIGHRWNKAIGYLGFSVLFLGKIKLKAHLSLSAFVGPIYIIHKLPYSSGVRSCFKGLFCFN